MKKILLILGVIVFVVIVGYVGWRYVFPLLSNESPGINTQTQQRNTAITTVSNRSIFSYWHVTETNELYYLTTEGEIYINNNGVETKITTQKLQNISSASPSFDGTNILIGVGPDKDRVLLLFNIETKTWQSLPQKTTAAAWSPEAQELVYFVDEGSTTSLYLFVLEEDITTKLLDFHQKDFFIKWLLPNELYVYEKPSSQLDSSIFVFNLETESFTPLIINVPALTIKWSDDGLRGLQFSHKEQVNNLLLINNNNQVIAPPPFTTLPSKCLIEADIVYCGVPRNLTSGTVLPDAYLKKQFFFEDTFIAWNTTTGEITILLSGDEQVLDIEKISRIDNALFFINRYDNKLYSLSLN